MANSQATKTAASKAAPAKQAAKKAPAKAAAKKAAAPKPVKHCLHGCGQQTKGGDFVIGHDAKLKSILQKAHVEAPDKPVDLGGKDKTPLHGMKPMEIAQSRKTATGTWADYLNKAKQTADDKAKAKEARKREPKVKGGPVAVGDQIEVQYRGKKRKGLVTEVKGERARCDIDVDGETESRPFGLESITKIKSASKAA